jgi:copper chaperone CopZ
MKHMKKILVALSLCIGLVACSESAAPAAPETVITHRDLDSEVNKMVAKMAIEGMMCAEGCGGKIQQDLQALAGVVSTELEFEEQRPENIVKVEYDPAVLSEQQLIQCVQGIADGKYHVKSLEVLHYHGLQSRSNGAAV